jgi:hypothetical protein
VIPVIGGWCRRVKDRKDGRIGAIDARRAPLANDEAADLLPKDLGLSLPNDQFGGPICGDIDAVEALSVEGDRGCRGADLVIEL